MGLSSRWVVVEGDPRRLARFGLEYALVLRSVLAPAEARQLVRFEPEYVLSLVLVLAPLALVQQQFVAAVPQPVPRLLVPRPVLVPAEARQLARLGSEPALVLVLALVLVREQLVAAVEVGVEGRLLPA